MNIVNPTDVRTLSDGRIMVSWAIDENTGYELTGETVFGLTSTDTQGRSVISYVGFTSNLKNLEQEFEKTVGIFPLTGSPQSATAVYAPDGTPRNHLVRGVNIVKTGDKVSKIYPK